MKILVTGGAGFIGSHLVDTLIDSDHDVTVYDVLPRVHETRSRYIQASIQDTESLEAAVRRADLVVHAAGILGTHETVTSAKETTLENVLGGLNVLEAVRKYGNGLINISKPNVWLNPYSITKDCVEKFSFMYAREFGAKVAILKLYNVYGPRQKFSKVRKILPTWIVQALRGEVVEVFGTGSATMDLIHVRDVCAATMATIENFDACCIRPSDEIASDVWSNFPAYNRQILEVGSGQETSVGDLVKTLAKVLDCPMRVAHLPMRRGEIDGTRLCANTSSLCRLTQHACRVPLLDGLRETVAYYGANLRAIESGVL